MRAVAPARSLSPIQPTARRSACALPSRWLALWLLGCLIVLGGCKNSPYAAQQQVMQFQQEQVALTRKTDELQARAAALDKDNQELQTLLSQSQQQSRLMEDQLTAVREQLTGTTDQLAALRDQYRDTEEKTKTLAASVRRRATASITANSSLRNTLPDLQLPGVSVRADGDVVRIELAAATMFDASGAQLMPESARTLDVIAAELSRNYPDQIIGVEGHTDTDPIRNSRWVSNHQLSVGRAMAVYDYLTTRARMRPDQLFVAGHGPNHPVVSNATPAGKERNRRVELVIYPERPAGR
jgi:chemotaxis protein MotB